jgi:hypothetical protein
MSELSSPPITLAVLALYHCWSDLKEVLLQGEVGDKGGGWNAASIVDAASSADTAAAAACVTEA